MFVIAFDAMWTVAKALNRTEEMRLKNVSRNDSTLEECRDLPGELVPLNELPIPIPLWVVSLSVTIKTPTLLECL